MTRPPRGLRRQIVASFVAFAAAVSLLVAGSGFLVAFIVEDALFENVIAEESARQRAYWREHRQFAPTSRDYVSIHASPESFPADLRREVRALGAREEYRGDEGRHYHVARLPLEGRAPAYVVAEVSRHLAVRPLRGELVTAMALIAAAILLVATALGYWLARRATAPLGRLVDAVSQVDPGQAPRIRAAEFPDNEVGALAATIEAMLERTRAFVERETRFTRDASHELRTPLAVIRSSAELIDSKGAVPVGLAGPLQRIKDAAGQMERAVELLLTLAREEKGAAGAGELALLPVVENALLAESARFGADRFVVRVSVGEDCRTRVPESVAAAILGNLIGNAFRHVGGGTLSISVEGAWLVIADTGPGLPPEVLRGLEAGDGAGLGIGLSIVVRLCAAHGIALEAASSPGAGTTFRAAIVNVPGTAVATAG